MSGISDGDALFTPLRARMSAGLAWRSSPQVVRSELGGDAGRMARPSWLSEPPDASRSFSNGRPSAWHESAASLPGPA
jgi:hypothetical protein